MSSDYFFKKWQNTLTRLENTVQTDSGFQNGKINDKTLCRAAQRLSGVLGDYIALYEDILDSLQQNLQVQKTRNMQEIIEAVVSRILELKHQLSKLTSSNYQFLGEGLIDRKLTTRDTEFSGIPKKIERPEEVKNIIEEIKKRAEEEKERLAKENEQTDVNEFSCNVWDEEDLTEEKKNKNFIEEMFQPKKENISEETMKIRELVNLIGAHERTRQITQLMSHNNLKKEMWVKVLAGTANPQARLEIRERAASIIKRACRCYFQLKRQRVLDCKRNELLQLKTCKKLSYESRTKAEEQNLNRVKRYKIYEDEQKLACNEMKIKYSKLRANDLADDYRDYIREWFQRWYKEVRFFYEIPSEARGGAALIFKEEVPTPSEWVDQYKAYMEQQKANKGQSAEQRKQEKLEAKREQMMLKKEQLLKEKMQAAMMKKLMKNPTNHPGYNFPPSTKTDNIIKAIINYRKDWDDLDIFATLDVKERSVTKKDKETVCMEVKIEVMKTIEEEMRLELKTLWKVLKTEYEINEEKMPEVIKERQGKRQKKKGKLKATLSANLMDKAQKLVLLGIMKEYPHTKLQDFTGDPNFAGDDLPCYYRQAIPFNGETRSLWWESCRRLVQGFHRILLVGPRGSGKTMLVHVMATLNEALLFELDPSQLPEELLSPEHLQQVVNSVVSTAKAFQPSVIYLKHAHRIFYKKVPPEESNIAPALLKKYFISKLFKAINKTDNITIIASCLDPWLTKSEPMLKQFPDVVLMPDTSYSTTVQILRDWVYNNRALPTDLDVHSLAYLLQGYSFGFLKQTLQSYLTADRIVKIAAKSLFPDEVHDYVISNDKDDQPNYEKYRQWYTDKTQWGQKEKKHIEEQMMFKELMDKFAEKAEKAKKGKNKTSPISPIVSDSNVIEQ